eukprot:14887-Heterococcus_DN1.PRE.2
MQACMESCKIETSVYYWSRVTTCAIGCKFECSAALDLTVVEICSNSAHSDRSSDSTVNSLQLTNRCATCMHSNRRQQQQLAAVVAALSYSHGDANS